VGILEPEISPRVTLIIFGELEGETEVTGEGKFGGLELE